MNIYTIASLLALALYSQSYTFASDFVLLKTFDDPTPTQGDFQSDLFGFSVATANNYVLIGARQDDTNGTNVGQAHLFETSTGQLLWTLDDPTKSGNDFFGHSTAIDGNQVLIGAPGDDTQGRDVGQAHLFDAATGRLLQTFDDPTPNLSGQFGFSVDLHNDRALIGARNGNSDGLSFGRAHLFSTSTGMLLHTFDDPTPTPLGSRGGSFGDAVAQFGNRLLIGEPGRVGFDSGTAGPGEVHVFDAVSGELLRTLIDPTPSSDLIFGDRFGSSVAISSSLILIGDSGDNSSGNNVGQAHLFDLSTGKLIITFTDPSVTGNDNFGTSVAIDGQRALIGASGDSTEGFRVGQAHLFETLSGGLIHTFDDPTVTGEDGFGFSVGLQGNQVLIGAYTDNTHGNAIGQVHLYAIVPEPNATGLILITGFLEAFRRRR